MSAFNPGRLRDLTRYTEPQPIVPGGSAFNLVSRSVNGRPVPAVGDYPSAAPGGNLSAHLSGGASDASMMPIVVSGLFAAALIGLAYLGDKK